MIRAASILLIATMLLVSCTAEVGDGIALDLEIAQAKSLNGWSADEIFRYEYKVTSLHEDDGHCFGEVPDWTAIDFPLSGKVNLGYFCQGWWRIEVKAFNYNNSPIYYGITEQFLAKGKANVVFVDLQAIIMDSDEAILDVEFVGTKMNTSKVEAKLSAMQLFVEDGDITTGSSFDIPAVWTMTDRPSGQVLYKTHIANLPSGAYLICVKLYSDGAFVSGQMLPITLVNGSVANIEGSLELGQYVLSHFAVTEDKAEISGYITSTSHIRKDPATFGNSGSLKANVSEVISLRWVDRNAKKASSVKWYCNGVAIGTGLSIQWSSAIPGSHDITATVVDSTGEKVSSAAVLVHVGGGL